MTSRSSILGVFCVTSMKIRKLILVLSPLVAGFLIYFSCRTRTLAYYSWLPFKSYIDLDSIHFAANEKCGEMLFGSPVGNVIVYSLPAALFAFSLTCYLKFRYFKYLKVFLESPSCHVLISFLLVLFISVFPELLQFYGLVPGSYDSTDVITAAIASVAALMIA